MLQVPHDAFFQFQTPLSCSQPLRRNVLQVGVPRLHLERCRHALKRNGYEHIADGELCRAWWRCRFALGPLLGNLVQALLEPVPLQS